MIRRRALPGAGRHVVAAQLAVMGTTVATAPALASTGVASHTVWLVALAGALLLGLGLGAGVVLRRTRNSSLTPSQGEVSAAGSLFEQNPLPMWVYDLETLRFLDVNEAAVAHYGYSRETFLAMDVLQIRPPEDWAAVREASRRPLAAADTERLWRHLTADGQLIDVEVHARDLIFEGRRARLVLAHDVTDRLLAERERHYHEQRFSLLARVTSDAIWDWDLATGQLWWSDSYYQLFGYSRERLPATFDAWLDRLHPDDKERVRMSLDEAIASGANEWQEHYRFLREDGSYADVEDSGFLLRDASGNPERFVGGLVDVTDKHRQEADLRLLRRAIASTENVVMIADARAGDLPIIYVNPAFERMTGYASDEVLGKNCRFLQASDRDQPSLERLRTSLREGGETQVVLRNYRKDGSLFLNEVKLSPVHNSMGELTHFVALLADVTERETRQVELAHRATHDELTGLPNRQLILDRLSQAILQAERYSYRVAVLFIDLDNFKLINDSYGHVVGDQILRQVADRFAVAVRESDSIGRFGGDEFVAILAENDGEPGLSKVTSRLFAALADPLRTDDGSQHYLTPSIGHCRFPEDGSDAEALLMRADIAMYKAKQRGRNCAVAYDPSFDAGAMDRLRLVSQLREALRRDEFVLHFQPLFGVGGDVHGLEALLRWQHPERGLLPPGQFVGLCEESGLIVPIGRWVLREAVRHLRELGVRQLPNIRIAVNVSAAQFHSELVDDVGAALAELGVPGGALELELTESVVMANPDAAIDMMKRLNALGVSIAIDDFGTGYSSLAYLKRLPIHRLKIDRTFVSDLEQDSEDQAICASIVSLARTLGLATTAEGVETNAQREWLAQRGCDELQGYLLGRPVPFAEILPLLEPGRPRH